MEIDYDLGLKRLRELLPPDNPSARDRFNPLEARLLENLADRRYGRDMTNTSQHNRIIDELSKFMSRELHLGLSFIDLCKSTYEPGGLLEEAAVEPAPPTSQPRPHPWQTGEKLSLMGQTYWIDGPVQTQWFNQGNALYLQAPGRHAQSGQEVWLKQCQSARSHAAGLTLKRDLEKEGRLLLKLQQDGQRDFPRWLASESSPQRTTLVYEMLAGRSLAEAFAATPGPLDQPATRRLLAGRQSLIQMLHTLHKSMNCSHRMLSPETLLLQRGSQKIKLRDVGLATCSVQPGEGPQFFQAPEQLRGLPVPGQATDIYQLGALFYYLLTGQYINDPATDRGSSLNPELDRVLHRAAAPLPRERWPDAHAFSQALRQSGY